MGSESESHKLFSSVKFIITGDISKEVTHLLQNNGAEHHNYFSDYLTHCIVGKDPCESDIDEAVEIYEIPVVTQEWVIYSCKCKKLLPTSAFKHGKQLFTGVIASVSKLYREDCKKLWAMLKYYGGSLDTTFKKITTHLIISKPEGYKYEQALRCPGTCVVTPDWVVASLRANCLMDEASYHPRLLILEKPSPSFGSEVVQITCTGARPNDHSGVTPSAESVEEHKQVKCRKIEVKSDLTIKNLESEGTNHRNQDTETNASLLHSRFLDLPGISKQASVNSRGELNSPFPKSANQNRGKEHMHLENLISPKKEALKMLNMNCYVHEKMEQQVHSQEKVPEPVISGKNMKQRRGSSKKLPEIEAAQNMEQMQREGSMKIPRLKAQKKVLREVLQHHKKKIFAQSIPAKYKSVNEKSLKKMITESKSPKPTLVQSKFKIENFILPKSLQKALIHQKPIKGCHQVNTSSPSMKMPRLNAQKKVLQKHKKKILAQSVSAKYKSVNEKSLKKMITESKNPKQTLIQSKFKIENFVLPKRSQKALIYQKPIKGFHRVKTPQDSSSQYGGLLQLPGPQASREILESPETRLNKIQIPHGQSKKECSEKRPKKSSMFQQPKIRSHSCSNGTYPRLEVMRNVLTILSSEKNVLKICQLKKWEGWTNNNKEQENKISKLEQIVKCANELLKSDISETGWREEQITQHTCTPLKKSLMIKTIKENKSVHLSDSSSYIGSSGNDAENGSVVHKENSCVANKASSEMDKLIESILNIAQEADRCDKKYVNNVKLPTLKQKLEAGNVSFKHEENSGVANKASSEMDKLIESILNIAQEADK